MIVFVIISLGCLISEQLYRNGFLIFLSAEGALEILALFGGLDAHVHVALLAERNVLASLDHHRSHVREADAALQSFSQLFGALLFNGHYWILVEGCTLCLGRVQRHV